MVLSVYKFSFMEEWKSYKLDDFIEFNPTISLKKGTMARKITMDQLTPHSRDIYSWGYEPYSGGAKFQNGDTIMARITPCLENGKHAFISLLDEGETAYGSTEYIVMRGKPGISDNRFVYYLSHYPDFKNAAIKSMVGSSGRQRAQVDVLKNLEFSLPGLEEQKQIADTLSALDDKIALNNRINHNLEEQAQALYKSWFVDFEPFKGGKFVDSEIGMIPEGWHVGTLSELLEVRYGKDHKALKDGNTPVFGSGGLMRYAERALYNGESVLIPRKGTLNNVMYFNGSFWTVDTMFYTVERSSNVIKYCHLFLLTQDLASMNAGSAVPSMTTDILNNLPLLIPSSQVLEAFNRVLSSIYEARSQREEESNFLSQSRDTILPQLMSGALTNTLLTC